MKNGGLVAHPARSDDAAGLDHMEQALDNGHLWDIVSELGMFCPWQVRIWPPQFAVFANSGDEIPEWEFQVLANAETGVISTSVHLTNCISEAQEASAAAAKLKGKAPQHSILKKIRAAINAFMLILHPEKPGLTYTSYVRAAAKNARLVAPMSKRYSFCFDISQIFDLFCIWYDKGFRNISMPLKMLRAKAIMLARIQTSCRSDDCAKVFRDVLTTRGKKYAGLLLKDNCIDQWRYHRPKNVGTLAGHMSALTSLGAPSFNDSVDTEKFCTAACLQTYMDRTDHLSREPVYVEDDTGYYPFFIALTTNKEGNYAGISAATIAKQVLWIMRLSGIDIEQFKAHCVRHSSLAAKRDFGIERDVFLTSAKMSGPVFEKYYNVPVVRDNEHATMTRRAHAQRQYGEETSSLVICD
eukprot:SAG11_NODE_1670_length_4486_cov_6.844313_3_plen_412_part_00